MRLKFLHEGFDPIENDEWDTDNAVEDIVFDLIMDCSDNGYGITREAIEWLIRRTGLDPQRVETWATGLIDKDDSFTMDVPEVQKLFNRSYSQVARGLGVDPEDTPLGTSSWGTHQWTNYPWDDKVQGTTTTGGAVDARDDDEDSYYRADWMPWSNKVS